MASVVVTMHADEPTGSQADSHDAESAARTSSDARVMPTSRGAVLLNLASDQYYSLNPTAAAIWQSLADGRTSDEAADALCREFEVSPADARACVTAFMDELARERLVTLPTSPTHAPEEPNDGQTRS